jgi:hypothetical protein
MDPQGAAPGRDRSSGGRRRWRAPLRAAALALACAGCGSPAGSDGGAADLAPLVDAAAPPPDYYTGPVVDAALPSLKDVIAVYEKAWGEPDPMKRAVLLDFAFAADGSYSDPSGPMGQAQGRAALDAVIQAFQKKVIGGTRLAVSGADDIADEVRWEWRAFAADGITVVTLGEDQAELASDGRLARVVSFYEPPPTLGSDSDAPMAALANAWSQSNDVARIAALMNAVGATVVYSDRARSFAAATPDQLVGPMPGYTFAYSTGFDEHDGWIRAGYQITDGMMAIRSKGQIFCHEAPPGAPIDTIFVFDGVLPPP